MVDISRFIIRFIKPIVMEIYLQKIKTNIINKIKQNGYLNNKNQAVCENTNRIIYHSMLNI